MLDELKFKFRQGNAIIQIILVNVAFFVLFSLIGVFYYLYNLSGYSDHFLQYLKLPASFINFATQPWSILTSMFIHEGFFHLFFNMLWLYWLGSIFQEYLGNSKTYQAYFLGGVFGGLVYMIAFNVFPAFSNSVSVSYACGASAGVLALVVATATLLPDYEVFLFIIGSIRLKYIALLVVIIDIVSIPQGNPGGHLAHLGGAAFGYFFIKLIYSQSTIPNKLDKAYDGLSSMLKPKSKLKIHYKNPGMRVESSNKATDAEIDLILEKIHKKGIDSLSKKEKDILSQASKD